MSPIDNLTLVIGQVAQMLGMSEPTFRKKRAELEALGFPRHLPGLKVYSRPAVERWFRTNGDQLATPAIEPTITVEINAAQAELETEYAA